jgi:putative addiction module killer protein
MMNKTITPKKVIVYCDEQGREPFNDWLFGLRDKQSRKRIESRIARVTQGNYGDYKNLGDGVNELRIFLVRAIEFILEKKTIQLWFFFVEEISQAKNKI